MKKVFLSYSRKDLKFVKQLAADLQQAGYDVWYDLSNIEGGDRWAIEIQTAIDNCDVCVSVISPNSIISEWVEKEFLYASNTGKRVIPILLESTTLPLWLMNIHYIDMQGRHYREKFPRLQAAIDEEEKPVLDFQSIKRLRAPGPVWIGGIVGIGILILAAVFGLPALKAKSTPTPVVFPTWTSPASTLTFTSVPATQSQTSTPASSPTTTEEVTPTMTTIPTPASAIKDAKGTEMVLVSSGIFKMGCNKGVLCEGPAHVVNLDSYYIDTYEVTNAQYLACEFDQQCNQPRNTRYYDSPSFRNHPVVFVTWSMAANYCAWRGARLPTEAEWEKAARANGTEMLYYPWGNRFNGDLLNFCDINCAQSGKNKSYNDGFSDTAPVGIYEGGKSPYGAYDMAGNVIEWVADWYDKDYYFISPSNNPLGPESGTHRVLRGGSWYSNQNYVRTFVRTSLSPTVAYNYVGFRCARSVGE